VSKTSISKSKARPAPSKQHKSCPLTSPTPSESDSTPESEPDSPRRSSTPPFEPDYLLAEVTHNEGAQDDEPIVPLALVHTLLHHHFSDKDKTRISQDAKALIGKYVDTFVREAIARSAFERQEKSAEDGAKASDHRGDDGWLEVEDLERMAPQLILDF
jgi:CENP-S associating Centromere protein X